MHRFRVIRPLRIAFVLSGVLAAGAMALAVHLDLVDSYPKADQVLTESPDSVRLWFNQVPELSLAAISLEGADHKVEMGKVQKTDDPKSVKAEVLEDLEPGSYRVTWRAAGNDGHAIRGRYDFEVRSGSRMRQ